MEDLSDHKWTCSCCGEEYVGLPLALAYNEPSNWGGLRWYERMISSASSDFCKIRRISGVERYIRCVLPFPIKGYDEEFHFGVWMSVSERSFKIYASGYDSEQYETDSCFGYLMHHIPEFGDTWALNTTIEFGKDGQRPLVFFHEYDHPLVYAQKEGLELDYVKRLISSGHRN